MIEVINKQHTESYGCFETLTDCKRTLNVLKNSGELTEPFHEVVVYTYDYSTVQSRYFLQFRRNKWRKYGHCTLKIQY